MITEDKSKMPLFSPEDEKEAQRELKRLRKNENGVFKVNHKRTGFEDKTLWDKLNLFGTLAIPLVVVLATIAFGIQQANLANQQHDNDQRIANQQHEADRQQALDQQRQAILVTYQDNMKDLLLNRGLLSSQPNDEVRVIARTETLSAIRQLDGKRNSFLVQFLQDAHLIGFNNSNSSSNIVNFENADLSSTDLRDANLTSADLRDANLTSANLTNATLTNATLTNATLSGAHLTDTNLIYADLTNATLTNATLSGADLTNATLINTTLTNGTLSGADLTNATLTDAHLTNTDLAGADLTGAHLTSVDLTGASLTQQQLDLVSTCKSATLPEGLTCHHNQ